jgi:hypothetical protein
LLSIFFSFFQRTSTLIWPVRIYSMRPRVALDSYRRLLLWSTSSSSLCDVSPRIVALIDANNLVWDVWSAHLFVIQEYSSTLLTCDIPNPIYKLYAVFWFGWFVVTEHVDSVNSQSSLYIQDNANPYFFLL